VTAFHCTPNLVNARFILATRANSRANTDVPPRRLDQFLANLGYCSRREARAWLGDGRVTVKGQPAGDPSEKANATDVLVDGEPLDHPDGLLLVLHKPTGLVCSHDEREGPNVYGLLPERWRRRNPQVTSIGRLDKDTGGLLLLTDQTALVHKLTSPKHKVPKTYLATVDHALTPELVPLFGCGDLLLTGEKDPCLPAELRILNPTTAELVLTEGRYHQVRRMFAAQGYEVLTLHRSHFGQLVLDDLPAGQWRELPQDYFGKS
jgi:16S rRNA pseudouridine516 synthase